MGLSVSIEGNIGIIIEVGADPWREGRWVGEGAWEDGGGYSQRVCDGGG